jgi:ABC-2 type transport system permease protein
MKQFLAFVRKEFYHIFRDRRTMIILLGMPVVQIIIFGFALTNEIKNSYIAVWDQSSDAASTQLISRVEASRYFEINKFIHTDAEIEKVFHAGRIRMVMVIPPNFQSDLRHQNYAAIQLIADASDPNLANTLVYYGSAIIMDYQNDLLKGKKMPYTIKPEIRMLYNPELKGAYNFVPGVMAMVLLLVCTMMTAITIVREKEMGTMELMLVSPMKPFRIVLAKAVPYLLLSAVNITSILLLSVFLLEVPINGSIPLLLAESILFTLVSLSLGLLISAGAASQQSAMFISLVAMLLPTVMLSGYMFPIENMPLPLRVVSHIVPARWYYSIVRSVMIKGVGFHVVWKETLILFGMFVFFLSQAIRKFKIRLS